MLLEFTVGNFLSFKDKKTLSLEAASIKDFEEDNVCTIGSYQLLKGAVIYGANASGKSNLTTAFQRMVEMVLNSNKSASTDALNVTPFLLNSLTETAPSHFEVLFLIEGIRYRYGFEVNKSEVTSEWLFEAKAKTEKPLFIREGDGIQVFPAFKEGKDLEEKTRDNALFLSIVDQFNGTIAGSIIRWFSNCKVSSALSHNNFRGSTIDLLETTSFNKSLKEFYRELDLGFDDIEIAEEEEGEFMTLKSGIKVYWSSGFSNPNYEVRRITTSHKKYGTSEIEQRPVNFNMTTQESTGTNKLFNVSGPIFQALSSGGVLMLDELDASLHPLLTLAITRLFNSAEQNSNNAQLIFATHDTNLLHYGYYRRDQIYFVEKDKYGASDLYSLAEFQVRKDASFEKDYIQGRYGAIPYIGDIQAIANTITKGEPIKSDSNGEQNKS